MMAHNLWGDKTITNLGIKSLNVTLQCVNGTNRHMRRHVLLGVGYNELRLRDESKVYQYEGNWFAAVSCVCIRDRLRVVGHLQRRMKMVNHQRINVMDRMELVEETFLRGMMNNGDVIRV